MDSVTARKLSASHDADRASWAVRELCCRTGNNGDPIAPERWELFPRIWIEPYEKIVPEWTYVAESGPAIVGYLTGCPDSQEFYHAGAKKNIETAERLLKGLQERQTKAGALVVGTV
ncbi:MAG: hypothetical protein ACREP3_14545 [Candidatus Binatia bacterium]